MAHTHDYYMGSETELIWVMKRVIKPLKFGGMGWVALEELERRGMGMIKIYSMSVRSSQEASKNIMLKMINPPGSGGACL